MLNNEFYNYKFYRIVEMSQPYYHFLPSPFQMLGHNSFSYKKIIQVNTQNNVITNNKYK